MKPDHIASGPYQINNAWAFHKLARPDRGRVIAVGLLTACLLGWICPPYSSAAEDGDGKDYDVVVYGGTSAGVTAAIQASRMGKRVVLVEPTAYVGGLTSSGLGYTDTGDKRLIGGLSREFYQRIKRYYDQESAWKHERPSDYSRYHKQQDAMWTFEPHVAQRVFDLMLKESGVRVVYQQQLDRQTGVQLERSRIAAITTKQGSTYRGRMFIDATYEGDLLASAGVSYTVGRESNAQYDETLNGVQTLRNTHNHRFLQRVDPYKIPGDATSGFVAGVQPGPPGKEGSADHRVQAYCFRMCMSNVAKNRVPFPKPRDYDESQFELLLRNFEAGDHRVPLHWLMMPNGKTDTNNNGALSTDYIGMNYEYPEATYEERDEIVKAHERYQKGLMWTLANHPRVPKSVRDELANWGLAADEFTDNGNWPRQLYVREARRMVSEYVVTERDCRRHRIADDSVGIGSYNMDSHNTQRYVTAEGRVENEGDVQVSPGGAYLISYRSIVPRKGEIQNLLVPVCLSASHIAYGSIRMEPVFMILGQSAATAAVMAIDGEMSVQEVAYNDLREQLLKDKQVLDLPADRAGN